MKMKSIFAFMAISFAIVSCSGSSHEEEEMDPDVAAYLEELEEAKNIDKTPINVTWEQIQSGELKKGQVLIFESYIQPLANERTTYSESTNYFTVSTRRNEDNPYYGRINLPNGTDPNEMKRLPEEYYHTDVKVTTSNDTIAGVSSRVKITGEYDPGIFPESSFNIDLAEVELLEGFDDSIFETAVPMTNEIAQDKTEDKRTYVYMDVELTFKYVFKIGQQNYSLGVDAGDVTEITTVMVQVGYWPGTMTTDDAGNIYLYDIDENLVQKGDKVRLYGSYNVGISSGTFKVEEVIKL